jgi:hypothetical protein
MYGHIWTATVLGSNLTYINFTLFVRNRREGLFSLMSAGVLTCPDDVVSWHMEKYVENQDANFSRPKSNRQRSI